MWERAPISGSGGVSQRKQEVVETALEDNNEAEARDDERPLGILLD